MTDISRLITAMSEYEAGCPRRIHHFLKVYAFAKAIGEQEGLPPETQRILEGAAVVHDAGIRPALEKYGSPAGPYPGKGRPGSGEGDAYEAGKLDAGGDGADLHPGRAAPYL